MAVPAAQLFLSLPKDTKKNAAGSSRSRRVTKTKMTYSNSVAAASGIWQPADGSHCGAVELSPDAVRLMGPTWCPSGIELGAQARAFVGDGWLSGLITATGCTWATVSTSRYGRHTVRDRRNLLVGAEAIAYQRAQAKWRREHPTIDANDGGADQ